MKKYEYPEERQAREKLAPSNERALTTLFAFILSTVMSVALIYLFGAMVSEDISWVTGLTAENLTADNILIGLLLGIYLLFGLFAVFMMYS